MIGLVMLYGGVILKILEGIFLILGILCFIKYLMKKNNGNENLKEQKIKKNTIGIIITICLLILIISCASIIIGQYFNGYVISLDSQSDVEEFIEILEENNLGFEVLIDNTSVKMENESDFNSAINLLEENRISFGYVVEGCTNTVQELGENSDYSEYPEISNLVISGADVNMLIRCNGMLYVRSYSAIDYAGTDEEPIGKVTDYIGVTKIPQKDFETNCKELVGVTILEVNSSNLVIDTEDGCILFERVYE